MAQGEVPFGNLSEEQLAKKINNSIRTKRKKSEEKWNALIPQMKDALSSNNNSRKKAAISLGIKDCTFRKYIQKTKNKVDWAKDFPIS
jgi:DNA invertase Pin-like site-specific DNA recombinase